MAGADLDRFYISKNDDKLTFDAKQIVAENMHRLLATIDAEEKRLSPSITASEASR